MYRINPANMTYLCGKIKKEMQGNLEWFRTFKAIYETGTLSGAAKKLYVSQPGVGLHLNALELYTGYPLFERTSRKMVPTERGHLLYQQLQLSINTLEEVEDRFRRKAGSDRLTVSVGMCVETFQMALEKYIPDLDFNLIMQFGESDKLVDMLENGLVDLILTTNPKESYNTTYRTFTAEQLVLVGGKKTDTSGWDAIDKSNKAEMLLWLRNQLWYNTASDLKLMNQFWMFNFGFKPDFVPNYIVPNKFSILRCLSAGKGLAILPDFIVKDVLEKENILLLWEGFAPLRNDLFFGKRKNALASDQILWIEQMLESEFQPNPLQSIIEKKS